jgi:hypothetical protein
VNNELNNYNINNPDGAGKVKYNEGKKLYSNDSPNFIKENSVTVTNESPSVFETTDGRPQQSASKSSASSSVTGNTGSTATDISSSVSSATASATASVTSAVGGGITALAGTVAASVAAAVVVVATFVSTLTITLTLIMSTMFSLVFQVDFAGAQEEDFNNSANPIVAILEDGDGNSQVQQLTIDSKIITFEDLKPGKEYTITIKNDEKVFVKKSYFTATEQVEKGFISASYDGDEVYVFATARLDSGEFYTLTVRDEQGGVIFARDDTQSEKEFSFTYTGKSDLYFTLSVSGKTYAVETLVSRDKQPEYDYDKGVWSWAEDYSWANITFEDIRGGEPLVVSAEITSTTIEPTCEEPGIITYIATYDNYTDTREEALSALGHDYGDLIEGQPADCETSGTISHYHCSVCGKYFDEEENEIEEASLIIPAGHDYGELIPENDGENGLAAHYECSVCHKLFDENYEETTAEDLELDVNIDEPLSNDVEISLQSGNICISPNGYARSESELSNPTMFVSSADAPYLIQNQDIGGCDNIIQVYQTDSSIKTADIYIKLSNVRLEAGSWCSLFLIVATNNLNIHLIIEGEVTFVGGSGQQIFSSQRSGGATVNVIIDQSTYGGTFNAEISDGLTYAQSGTINVNYV